MRAVASAGVWRARLLYGVFYILAVFSLAGVSGCSSGRAFSSANSGHGVSQAAPAYCASQIVASTSVDRKNAIFVHPGMVWVSDRWDAGPIVLTGNLLREEGYADRVVVVRDRDPAHVYAQMMADPGTQFVGLHYSMGGNADLLAKTYEATRRASLARGAQLRYHAVLIDPYDISRLGDNVDITQPEVGRLLFVLSSENSMLRGRVSGLSEAVSTSPKANFVYAEDVGEQWGHFSILPSGRTLGQSGFTGQSGASPQANHKTMMLLRAFMSIVHNASADDLQVIDGSCLVSSLGN